MAEEVPQPQPPPDHLEVSGVNTQTSGDGQPQPAANDTNEKQTQLSKGKQPEKQKWIPELPHLPTEILAELPKHGLSYKELRSLVRCNKRFSQIFQPFLKAEAFADRDGMTALEYAIKNNNEKHVQYILDNSHDEEEELEAPWHPFTVAFYQGNPDIIIMMAEYILQVCEGYTSDFMNQASSGLTCLVHHTGVYDTDVIDLLMELGADPGGWNPLELTDPTSNATPPRTFPSGELLFEIKDPQIFKYLVTNGARIDQRRGGQSLLENAIEDEDFHQVVPAILSAMHKAGHTAETGIGNAFILAAEGPYPDIAEEMLAYEFGDAMFETDRNDRGPMHVLAEAHHSDETEAAVFMSILIEYGIDIDAPCRRVCPTPLLIAAACGNWHIVQILIMSGAWVKQKSAIGKNVFHYVLEVKRPDLDLVEYMLEDGGVGKVGYGQADIRGDTAFQQLYTRAHRQFLGKKRIGTNLRRVFFAVMKYLTSRKDRGGKLGCNYRWLWSHAKRSRKYRYRPYVAIR